MFNISNKIVTIPALLHFLHGKESNLADLVMVYGTALLSGLFIGFSLTITDALLSGQKLVIILLVLDFSGGIVANFTKGTRTFYAHPSYRKWLFVLLHWIQPLLLALIFPDSFSNIIIISSAVLLSTLSLIMVRDSYRKQIYAAVLFSFNLILLFILNPFASIVNLIVILFMVKLLLSFATNPFYHEKHNQ